MLVCDDTQDKYDKWVLRIVSVILFTALIFNVFILCGKIERLKSEVTGKTEKINQLELKIERLEKCCRWSTILEQMLPPLAQAELDVMVEQLKQNKERQNGE